MIWPNRKLIFDKLLNFLTKMHGKYLLIFNTFMIIYGLINQENCRNRLEDKVAISVNLFVCNIATWLTLPRHLLFFYEKVICKLADSDSMAFSSTPEFDVFRCRILFNCLIVE